MTKRIEIDHLTVSSLNDLNGRVGLGYVSGFCFEAQESKDGQTCEIAITGPRGEWSTNISMGRALIAAEGAQDLCRYLYGRIEARGGLEIS